MKSQMTWIPAGVLLITLTAGAATVGAADAPAVAPAAPTVSAAELRISREDLIRQFDQNADGILDESERAKARAYLQRQSDSRKVPAAASRPTEDSKRSEIIKRYDTNGDGRLDNAEREAARTEVAAKRTFNRPVADESSPRPPAVDRAAILKEFDLDGDGQLNDEERRTAAVTMRARVAAQSGATTAAGSHRETQVQRYDKNGDGRIDGDELTAMREEFQKRRKEQTAGDGPQTIVGHQRDKTEKEAVSER